MEVSVANMAYHMVEQAINSWNNDGHDVWSFKIYSEERAEYKCMEYSLVVL